MAHILPPLPYAEDSLTPYISVETIQFHYHKHHQTYVTNLNTLIQDTNFKSMSLEEIIKNSSDAIFNNAAQVWNHTFFWKSLSPNGGGIPTGKLNDMIISNWGSYNKFKETFTNVAISTFGSGWVWLVKKHDNSLDIISTSNAINPIGTNNKPLLTIDVWEHAYYIDYRNARAKFIEIFWDIVNWDFASKNFE
ncbi:MAG: Fe-Mn family superoxide dismutase [Burkholderia sp.]|nr:Fe-Mn family superoxide dismutase [Burkholderia sp.]